MINKSLMMDPVVSLRIGGGYPSTWHRWGDFLGSGVSLKPLPSVSGQHPLWAGLLGAPTLCLSFPDPNHRPQVGASVEKQVQRREIGPRLWQGGLGPLFPLPEKEDWAFPSWIRFLMFLTNFM